jgi:hypothetical protein
MTTRHPAARILGAVLCLAVAAIHVKDQGGIPGSEDPAYIHYLFLALEAGAVIVAVALLVAPSRAVWSLAALVALAPIVGYVLTRGPGLPDATDDKGNWGEPLGVASLVVEGLLLILSLAMLRARERVAPAAGERFRRRETERAPEPAGRY